MSHAEWGINTGIGYLYFFTSLLKKVEFKQRLEKDEEIRRTEFLKAIQSKLKRLKTVVEKNKTESKALKTF